jgi:hypothetical protein
MAFPERQHFFKRSRVQTPLHGIAHQLIQGDMFGLRGLFRFRQQCGCNLRVQVLSDSMTSAPCVTFFHVKLAPELPLVNAGWRPHPGDSMADQDRLASLIFARCSRYDTRMLAELRQEDRLQQTLERDGGTAAGPLVADTLHRPNVRDCLGAQMECALAHSSSLPGR